MQCLAGGPEARCCHLCQNCWPQARQAGPPAVRETKPLARCLRSDQQPVTGLQVSCHAPASASARLCMIDIAMISMEILERMVKLVIKLVIREALTTRLNERQ